MFLVTNRKNSQKRTLPLNLSFSQVITCILTRFDRSSRDRIWRTQWTHLILSRVKICRIITSEAELLLRNGGKGFKIGMYNLRRGDEEG